METIISFLKNYAQGFGSSFVFAGLVYLLIWVILRNKLNNRKIQLSKRAGWDQIKEELINSGWTALGGTIFTMVILSMNSSGLVEIYTDTAKYGIGYIIFTVIVMLLISDTRFYWSHRLMHHPKLYKYVHAVHHASLDVNPFTSFSFHVVESIALSIWVLPLAMVMPIGAAALGVVQMLGTLNNLKSHLGYELFPGFFHSGPFSYLVSATNHSLHHTQYKGNYGLFLRFWDIWCGTELTDTQSIFDQIHERKNAVIIDNTVYQTLTIDKLIKENSDTISVYFRPSQTQFYIYEAGQYLTVKVTINGKVHHRCFSLSSSPEVDDFLRISVRLNGEVSHYFYNDAKVGDTIQSLLPVGDFVLKPAISYTMIAGGSGITPLYSMIRQLLHRDPDSRITLLYANKSPETIIFGQELQALAQKYKHFNYQDFISGQSRISKADLSNLVGSDFYICGPDSLKDVMYSYLTELKVDPAMIYIEHYADGYVPWFGLFTK